MPLLLVSAIPDCDHERPPDPSVVFSALRVYALTRNNRWLACVVLLLSLVPFVENVVSCAQFCLCLLDEHVVVSIHSSLNAFNNGILP